jgi:2,4-dienoyl-CoA reductase (NADPH2)
VRLDLHSVAAQVDRFPYKSLEDLQRGAERAGIRLPAQAETRVLATPLTIGKAVAANRLCVNPMEGCDAARDGTPTELSLRRYARFAAGGAGVIWVEATAVCESGRGNPGQFWLSRDSSGGLARIPEAVRALRRNQASQGQTPVLILQLTHSGRYSKPAGVPAPIIPVHSSVLDPLTNVSPTQPLITDAELEGLERAYVDAARLADEMGFDGVDVKACHGYLVHELLCARDRIGSVYGGSFENRTRFLRNVVGAIRSEVPGLIIASRLSVYDGIPSPWGWGMKGDGTLAPDLSEPAELIGDLGKLGVEILSLAVGNPYYNPHMERPYDKPLVGGSLPSEHPMESIARLVSLFRAVRTISPRHMVLVGTGFSWLRQYLGNVGAALVQEGAIDLLGVGRTAIAAPWFARELIYGKALPAGDMCTACSSCSQLMRDGKPSGCIVRDSAIYAPFYRSARMSASSLEDAS